MTRSRWAEGALALAGLSLVVVLAAVAMTGAAKGCVRLWNAPDNGAVRAAVAAEGYRHAALTTYRVEGPGSVCYVTMLDGSGEPRGTFAIWPDNLFDNGSLDDYAGPFSKKQGYMGHVLSRAGPVPFR